MEDKALSKVKASTKKVVRVKDVGAAAPPKSLWRNQKPHHGWKLDHEAFLSKMLHPRLENIDPSTSNWDRVDRDDGRLKSRIHPLGFPALYYFLRFPLSQHRLLWQRSEFNPHVCRQIPQCNGSFYSHLNWRLNFLHIMSTEWCLNFPIAIIFLSFHIFLPILSPSFSPACPQHPRASITVSS